MDGKKRRFVKETFDLGLGFVGFFLAAFFVITLVLDVTGKDAFAVAVTTAILAMLLVALWVVRRRFLAGDGTPDGR